MRNAQLVSALFLVFAACSSELPHDAPYDPDAPAEKQAKGQLTGRITLENESDHSQVAVQLQNAERTYSVQTEADGSVSLTGVVPGDYTLKIGTRYFEHVTETVTVKLGEELDLGARALAARRTGVFGKAVIEDKDGNQAGGVSVSLRRTGSLRTASAAPALKTAAAAEPPGAGISFSVQSDESGSYQVTGVPSGVYEVIAAVPGEGVVSIPKVTVTGEDGDVEVKEAVILPMFGFLEILGKVNGAVTNPTVTLKFTATGNPASIEVAFDPGFVSALPVMSYTQTTTIDLPAGDGLKAVYVRYFDADGNESSTGGDTVTLDTTPPQPVSFAIVEASPTKTNPITLSYAAPGATEFRVTEGATCGGSREPVSGGTKVFSVSGSEGVKSVSMQFFDAAGNASECVVRTVFFDPNPPVVGTFTFGAAATSSNVVTVTFQGVSGASKVIVSEDAGFAGADWTAYAPAKTFVLSFGNGVKTVYAKVADDAGHVVSLTQQTITLDTTPPTAPSIFAAVDVTTQTSVLLTLSAGLVSDMWITVDDPSFSTGAWESYSGSKVVTLAGTDGTQTIYAKFKKSTGLETGVVSDTVVLDRAAPILPSVLVNGGAAVVTSEIVTLNLSAVDTASGLATYKVNTTNDFSAVSPKSFQPTDVFSFATGDGVKTVWVTIGDRAGLYSTPVSATVLLDTTPPNAGSIAVTKLDGTPLNAGGKVTENRVVVTSTVSDSSTLEMQVTTNGSYVGVAWVPFEPNKVIDLTTGTPSISVRVRDGAGLITNLLTAFNLTVDTAAPTLTFSRTSAAITSSLTVSLSLAANETCDAQISESSSFGGASWFPAANTTVVLPAGDGLRTLYARARDLAENISTVMSVTVQIDTVAPSGAVLINQGAAATVTNAVTLQLSGIDSGSGIDGVKLADTLAGLAAASVVPMEATKAYTLGGASGPGIEETKTVWMQVVDRAGLTSPAVSDDIRFDRKNPAGSIALSTAVTNDTLVGVDLTYDVDVTHMRLSYGNACAGGNWIEASPETVFTLPGLDGAHDVSVRFRDGVLNESTCYSASVVLDRAGPTPQTFTVTGNAGASVGYSDTPDVTIDAGTPAGDCAYAELAEDVGFIAPTVTGLACSLAAEPYALINTAEGFHTLYLRYYDTLGNPGPVTGATLVLDTADPQVTVAGGFTIAQGVYTNNPDVTLQLAAAGATKVAFGEGAGCAFTPEAYLSTKGLTLSGSDGAKTVSVQYADDAGNASACYAQTVTLDTYIAPFTVSLTGADGNAGTTASQAVTVTVTGVDSADVVDMRAGNSAGLAGAVWEPYTASFTWFLPQGDGAKAVYVAVRDRAGNVADASGAILLDTTPPAAPILQAIDVNGDGFAASGAHVELGWPLVSGAAQLRMQALVSGIDVTFRDLPSPAPSAVTYWATVTQPGYRILYRLGAYDAVGNFSGWSSTVEARPMLPQNEIAWIYRQGAYQYQVPMQRGVFGNTWAYTYLDIADVKQEVNLAANTASWSRPVTSVFEVNESIRLRTENVDRSLVFEGEYSMGTIERERLAVGPYVGDGWEFDFDTATDELQLLNSGTSGPRVFRRDANGAWYEETLGFIGGIAGKPDWLHVPGQPTFILHANWGAPANLLLNTRISEHNWISQTLATFGSLLFTYGGVMAPNGGVHVLYKDPSDKRIFYQADVTTTAWAPVDIALGRATNDSIEVKANAAGEVYASFVSSDAGLYVVKVFPAPRVYTLVDAGGTGNWFSFDIEADGTMRLAYGSGTWRYGINTGGSWVTETAAVGASGRRACAVRDETGAVHYFFDDNVLGDLYYVRRDPTAGWGAPRLLQSVGQIGGAVKTGPNTFGLVHGDVSGNEPVLFSMRLDYHHSGTLTPGGMIYRSMVGIDAEDRPIALARENGGTGIVRAYRDVFDTPVATSITAGLDTTPSCGYPRSFFDENANPRVVQCTANSDITLLSENAGAWSSELITTATTILDVGYDAGVTHVVVPGPAGSAGIVGRRQPGGWSFEQLPLPAGVANVFEQRFHFAGTESTWVFSGTLNGFGWGTFFAQWVGGSWQVTPILNRDARPKHVARRDDGSFFVLIQDWVPSVYSLVVADNQSGSWVVSELVQSSATLDPTRVEFDSAGRALFVGHVDGKATLFRQIDKRWVTTTLPGLSSVVHDAVLDSRDRLVMVSHSGFDMNLVVEQFPLGVLTPHTLGPIGPAE